MLYHDSDFLSGLSDDVLPYLIYADYLDEIGRFGEAESLRLLDADPMIVNTIGGSEGGHGYDYGHPYEGYFYGFGGGQRHKSYYSRRSSSVITLYLSTGITLHLYGCGKGNGHNIGK